MTVNPHMKPSNATVSSISHLEHLQILLSICIDMEPSRDPTTKAGRDSYRSQAGYKVESDQRD
jgi:hypothetical protein